MHQPQNYVVLSARDFISNYFSNHIDGVLDSKEREANPLSQQILSSRKYRGLS